MMCNFMALVYITLSVQQSQNYTGRMQFIYKYIYIKIQNIWTEMIDWTILIVLQAFAHVHIS